MSAGFNFAFCNDCDLMDWNGYMYVHSILDSLELPAGDSFWLFDPSGSDMALFRHDLDHPGPKHKELLDEIAAGRLDVLHSAGSYGARFNQGYRPSRNLIAKGLEYLNRHAVVPRIWTNHGDACNTQNIGGAVPSPHHHGDLPGDEAYSLDLLLDHGIEFFWLDRLLYSDTKKKQDISGTDNCRSGHNIKTFYRFWGLSETPHALNLCDQLSSQNIKQFRKTGQDIVCYTHWGLHVNDKGSPYTPAAETLFNRKGIESLEHLSGLHHRGKIRVSRTYELLKAVSTSTPQEPHLILGQGPLS